MSIFQLFQVKNIEQHQTLESWTLGTRGNLLRKVLQPNMIHCKTQSIISKFHQLNIINDSINNSYIFNVHRVLEVTLRIRPYTLLVSFQQRIMPRLLAKKTLPTATIRDLGSCVMHHLQCFDHLRALWTKFAAAFWCVLDGLLIDVSVGWWVHWLKVC